MANLIDRYKEILEKGINTLSNAASSYVNNIAKPIAIGVPQVQQTIKQIAPPIQSFTNRFAENINPISQTNQKSINIGGQYLSALGKAIQPTPQVLEKTPFFLKPSNFIASMPGQMIESFGQTTQRFTTPSGRQELKTGLKELTTQPLSLKTLENPAVQAGFDVSNLIPGFGFVGAMALQKGMGKKTIEKVLLNTRNIEKTLAKSADYDILRESAQMDVIGELGVKLKEFYPEVAKSGPMKDLLRRDPREWVRQASRFLGSRVQEAREGFSPLLGASVKELKGKPILSRTKVSQPQITKQTGKLLQEAPQVSPTGVQPGTTSIPSDLSIAQKERGFITTVKESEKTPKIVKKTLNSYYTPTTNPQDMANADNVIRTLGWDGAKSKVMTKPWSAENAMIGQNLAARAFKEKRFQEGNDIIEAISAQATRAGQGNQALSIWSRFTPEGMVKYAQSQLTKANNTMPLLNKILGTKKAVWTPEDSKIISGMMTTVNKMPDGRNKEKATLEMFEYISKKLPWGVSDAIDEFRYNNMLSNPLTHLRNAVNNLQQAFIVRPATIAAQGKIGDAVKYEIGALKSFPDALDAFKETMKSNKTFGKMDIAEMGNQLRKPKKLGAYNLPSNAMEGMDKFFTAIIKGGERARGATDKAANAIAEYSLFRQDLNPAQQGHLLNAIDNVTKVAYQLRKVGLGWFIPFLRTPMNVAKQWIEYSPAGFATMLGTGAKKEQAAKAMLGSIATLVGAEMALQGRTTWDVPTDPTEKKLFYDSGRKPYSVKIGDKWVPMQTFGVFALAMGLPAAINYVQKESQTALSDDQTTKIAKMLLSPLKFWSQQTFVSGLGSFINLAEGNTDYTWPKTIAFTASQMKPYEGLLRYISTLVDPVFRKPEGLGQNLISDIPFATKNPQPYTNTFGEPSTRNWSNYLAPYAMGQDNPQFDQMYQTRKGALQQNAVENEIKNQMEQTQGDFSGMKGGTATYNIGGTDVSGKVIDGKFYYQDPETGTIKNPTVAQIESDQKDYQIELNSAKLTNLKNKEDYSGWLDVAESQMTALQEQLDKATTEKDKLDYENKISTLAKSISKYKGQGGFSKGKKITLKKVTYPKIKAPKIQTVKAKKAKKRVYKNYKLSVAKIKSATLKKSAKLKV